MIKSLSLFKYKVIMCVICSLSKNLNTYRISMSESLTKLYAYGQHTYDVSDCLNKFKSLASLMSEPLLNLSKFLLH